MDFFEKVFARNNDIFAFVINFNDNKFAAEAEQCIDIANGLDV